MLDLTMKVDGVLAMPYEISWHHDLDGKKMGRSARKAIWAPAENVYHELVPAFRLIT